MVATDLDTGEEVVFVRGPLKPALLASAALPGHLPADPPRRPHAWSTARSSTPCPLWHALSGPVDRIYVMNVAGDLLDRPLRSPIDVVMTSFAISRKQRFELELRNVPESRRAGRSSPRPVDERELFDFSGGEALIEVGLRARRRSALDDADGARADRRRQLRRSWWRRDAGRAPLATPIHVVARQRQAIVRCAMIVDPGDDVGEERGVLGEVDEHRRARCRARWHAGGDREHDPRAGVDPAVAHAAR